MTDYERDLPELHKAARELDVERVKILLDTEAGKFYMALRWVHLVSRPMQIAEGSVLTGHKHHTRIAFGRCFQQNY